MVKAVYLRRYAALAGTILVVLLTMGGWAAALQDREPSDPLFSVDAFEQAKAGVESQPWSDPVDWVLPGGDEYVTRGQLAMRLADTLGLQDSTGSHFTDLIGPEDCFGAVGALHEEGLLTGATSPEFSPDHPVSRQQALVWIVDALGYELNRDSSSSVAYRFSYFEPVDKWLGAYHDRELVSEQLGRGVANAYRLGIVDVPEDGCLYPTFPLNTPDLEAMLQRAFSNSLTAKAGPPESVTAKVTYPSLQVKSEGTLVWDLEYQLAALKYRPGPIDGIFDVRTRDAVYAFQKVSGLKKDGIVGESFWRELAVAETPKPVLDEPGARVEVDLTRQVLFLIKDNQVWKVMHISSGKSTTATLTGHFEVEKKVPRWLHDSYNTTMYYSSFFDVGHRLAFHGYSDVPTWAASHGCVRCPNWMAKELYEELPVGTPVYIYKS